MGVEKIQPERLIPTAAQGKRSVAPGKEKSSFEP